MVVCVRRDQHLTGDVMHRKIPDKETLLELLKSGLTQKQIADRYGATQTTVGAALRRAGVSYSRHHRKSSWTGTEMERLVCIYREVRTVAETARILGVKRSTVRHCLNRAGEPILSQSDAQSGHRNRAWKGGTWVDANGYVMEHSPTHPHRTSNGYMCKHRLVMEKECGRYLRPGEVVHHIDGNPANNSPSNLQLFASNADHLRQTLSGKRPRWTEQGRERMIAGLHAWRERRRILKLSKLDARPSR